jgi:predicted GNAT superfamily acetyltransferase
VAARAPPPGLDEFRLRRLEKPEEFRAAAELARSSGATGGTGTLPHALLRAMQDHGGLVLGAFVDIHLAGLSAGFLGWDGSTLYLYSHLTAVRPEYRHHGLGRRLKLRQREEVLGWGLTEIRWTFDPLESPQAHLYVQRLGARPDRYLVHHFGRPEADEGPLDETDRVRVRWALSDPAVTGRLEARAPDRSGEEERWRGASAIVETEVGEQGLRHPTAVTEPSAARAQLEIPFDLGLMREHEPSAIRPWRHAVRDAFRAAFDLGYKVEEFVVVSPEHERRSFYLLARPAESGVAPGPATPRREGR